MNQLIVCVILLSAVSAHAQTFASQAAAFAAGKFATIDAYDHGELTATAGDLRYVLKCNGNITYLLDMRNVSETCSALTGWVGQKILTVQVTYGEGKYREPWVQIRGGSWTFINYPVVDEPQKGTEETWEILSIKPVPAKPVKKPRH